MSEAQTNSLPTSQTGGDIPLLLVKEGLITDDQLAYAVRIKAKLSSNNTIIDTIKELGYATGEQIRATLSKNHTSIRIGSLLVELGYIHEADLNAALHLQKESPERKKLGEVLIDHGFIDEHKFNEILAVHLGIPLIELGFRKIDAKLFAQAHIQKCLEFQFVPVEKEDNRAVVAFADPLDKASRATAEKIFGDNLKPVLASRKSVLEAIAVAENNASHPEASLADENTVIGIINKLFDDAISENASDIHIEPMKDRIRIRFRYDGVMMHHKDLPLDIAPQLSTRIKVMAQADIAERRRHQDGRILLKAGSMGTAWMYVFRSMSPFSVKR